MTTEERFRTILDANDTMRKRIDKVLTASAPRLHMVDQVLRGLFDPKDSTHRNFRLINGNDAAKMLNLSLSTIIRLKKSGIFEVVNTPRGSFIREESVIEFALGKRNDKVKEVAAEEGAGD